MASDTPEVQPIMEFAVDAGTDAAGENSPTETDIFIVTVDSATGRAYNEEQRQAQIAKNGQARPGFIIGNCTVVSGARTGAKYKGCGLSLPILGIPYGPTDGLRYYYNKKLGAFDTSDKLIGAKKLSLKKGKGFVGATAVIELAACKNPGLGRDFDQTEYSSRARYDAIAEDAQRDAEVPPASNDPATPPASEDYFED